MRKNEKNVVPERMDPGLVAKQLTCDRVIQVRVSWMLGEKFGTKQTGALYSNSGITSLNSEKQAARITNRLFEVRGLMQVQQIQ